MALTTKTIPYRSQYGGLPRHAAITKIAILIAVFLIPPLYAGTNGKVDAPFLPTGSMLRVTITNAIFSYNLVTPVIAELDGPVNFNERKVLPNKTKLLGRALVLKSSDRVNIEFDLAVLPDGREIPITGLALSADGSAGIRGTVKKHKDSVVASAALKGAILGTAAAVGGTINPIAAGAGDAAAQEAAKEIDTTSEQVDTSISIPAFTRCLIFLSRRLKILKKEVNE